MIPMSPSAAPSPAVVVDVVSSTPLVRVDAPSAVSDLGAHIMGEFVRNFPAVVHPAVTDKYRDS